MKYLHEALKRLRGETDLASQPAMRLETDVVSLRRLLDGLEAEWLRRVAALDAGRTGDPEEPLLGMTSWLVRFCRMSRGVASRRLGLARRLWRMPRAVAALERSEVALGHLETLGRAERSHPIAFARDEETLVAAAGELSVQDLGTVVRYWSQNLDQEAAVTDSEHLHHRRRASLSETFMGMYRLDADIDPEGGAVVGTALNAVMDADAGAPDDERTTPQRRADALVAICRSFLDQGRAPTNHGQKPHLLVMVDLETLEGRAGRRCELDQGGVITPEAARRLACDATVCRLIVGPDSEILDMGRLTRTVTPGQWRALVARDGGCRFPGCERPHRWCDAHHVRHWLGELGMTDLANLVLLCRRHHRLLHEGRYRIDSSGGHFEFMTPDGRPVEALAA